MGFVELSRLVASRWSKLDRVDPETFAFVHELAAEKRREMDQYNRMIAASGESGSKRRLSSSSALRTTRKKPSRKIVSNKAERDTKPNETFYKPTDLEVDLCEKCSSESSQVAPAHGPSSDLAPSGEMVDLHDHDIIKMWTGK